MKESKDMNDNREETHPLTIRTSIRTTFLLAVGIVIAFAISVVARQNRGLRNLSPASAPQITKANPTALNIQVQAAQGAAASGNMQPANFLVLVTDAKTGVAVTDLVQSNFSVIAHFSGPCGFSNNITSFVNVGTGAYQIQVRPVSGVWLPGDCLAQVIVDGARLRGGQAPATLSIRQ